MWQKLGIWKLCPQRNIQKYLSLENKKEISLILSNYKHWSRTKQDLKEENEISLTEADKSIMKIHNKNYFIIMLDQWMSHLNLLSKFNF